MTTSPESGLGNSDTIWVHIYNNGKKVESGAKSDIIFEKTPVAGDEITYVYIAKNDKQLAELIYVIDGRVHRYCV